MAEPRKRTGSWVALAAAYLLFVQALLTGASLGAQAAPSVDFHGIVICHPSALDDSGAGTPDDHGSAATCCALGCAAAGGMLPPPQAPALKAPLRPAASLMTARAEPETGPPSPRTPRLTRAPPVA